jgi:hypothetical protein
MVNAEYTAYVKGDPAANKLADVSGQGQLLQCATQLLLLIVQQHCSGSLGLRMC